VRMVRGSSAAALWPPVFPAAPDSLSWCVSPSFFSQFWCW
jgi:hypothetical protein